MGTRPEHDCFSSRPVHSSPIPLPKKKTTRPEFNSTRKREIMSGSKEYNPPFAPGTPVWCDFDAVWYPAVVVDPRDGDDASDEQMATVRQYLEGNDLHPTQAVVRFFTGELSVVNNIVLFDPDAAEDAEKMAHPAVQEVLPVAKAYFEEFKAATLGVVEPPPAAAKKPRRAAAARSGKSNNAASTLEVDHGSEEEPKAAASSPSDDESSEADQTVERLRDLRRRQRAAAPRASQRHKQQHGSGMALAEEALLAAGGASSHDARDREFLSKITESLLKLRQQCPISGTVLAYSDHAILGMVRSELARRRVLYEFVRRNTPPSEGNDALSDRDLDDIDALTKLDIEKWVENMGMLQSREPASGEKKKGLPSFQFHDELTDVACMSVAALIAPETENHLLNDSGFSLSDVDQDPHSFSHRDVWLAEMNGADRGSIGSGSSHRRGLPSSARVKGVTPIMKTWKALRDTFESTGSTIEDIQHVQPRGYAVRKFAARVDDLTHVAQRKQRQFTVGTGGDISTMPAATEDDPTANGVQPTHHQILENLAIPSIREAAYSMSVAPSPAHSGDRSPSVGARSPGYAAQDSPYHSRSVRRDARDMARRDPTQLAESLEEIARAVTVRSVGVTSAAAASELPSVASDWYGTAEDAVTSPPPLAGTVHSAPVENPSMLSSAAARSPVTASSPSSVTWGTDARRMVGKALRSYVDGLHDKPKLLHSEEEAVTLREKLLQRLYAEVAARRGLASELASSIANVKSQPFLPEDAQNVVGWVFHVMDDRAARQQQQQQSVHDDDDSSSAAAAPAASSDRRRRSRSDEPRNAAGIPSDAEEDRRRRLAVLRQL